MMQQNLGSARGIRALAAITVAVTMWTWVAVAQAGPGVPVSDTEPGPTLTYHAARADRWIVLNGGNYVDAGTDLTERGYVETMTTDSGQLLYFFHDNIGTIMGRLSTDLTWDLWVDSAWENESDTVPTAIEGSIGRYRPLRVFQHPDYHDGLFGVAPRSGLRSVRGFNVHGTAVNFEFDEHSFSQWKTGTTYDPLYRTTLISTWNGDSSDFDFNPKTGIGLNVGVIGYFLGDISSQLTATRYDHNDASQRWRRWHRPSTADDPTDPIEWGEPGFSWLGTGDWYDNNSWPSSTSNRCRKTFVMDSDVDFDGVSYTAPKVTHIPDTNTFFVTVSSSGPDMLGGPLKPLLYEDGDTPTWYWWAGREWAHGGDYALCGVADVASTDRVQFYWQDGRIEVLFVEGGELKEFSYNHRTGSFTRHNTLSSVQSFGSGAPGFCVGVDAENNIWLFWTEEGRAIQVRRKTPLSGWEAPTTIYKSPDESVQVCPAAVGFVEKGYRPVLFVSERREAVDRLFAIAKADDFWKLQIPREFDKLPSVQMLDPDVYAYERTVSHRAPDKPYGGGTPGPMGLDRDGYVYSSSYGNTGLVVFPPNGTTWQDNHSWGGFWDHLSFPGGTDVDRQRNKVYIANALISGGGGSLHTSGNISIWSADRRDDSCGWAKLGGTLPDYWNKEYYPQRLYRSFGWPADVAVDAERGLLYVTNALQCRVDVFDIENLVDSTSSFARAGLFESRIISSHLVYVQELVHDLIEADYLCDGPPIGDQGGESLTWVPGHDLEAEIVPFLNAQPAYANLDSSEDEHDFIRNVYSHYNARHDRPVFLYSFGSYGSGHGEFRFPQGIDVNDDGDAYIVDCENNRIQHWQLDEHGEQQFVDAWGSLGRKKGEFIYPLGISVDDAYHVVHVTDPYNGRIQAFAKDGHFMYEWGAWDDGTVHTLDNSLGVASDDHGGLLVGVGQELVRFRSSDELPQLTVNYPSACVVAGFGMNSIVGFAVDDVGIDRVTAIVTCRGQLIDQDVAYGSGDFRLEWKLPDDYPVGRVARIEVTAYDLIGQTDKYITSIWLKRVGDPRDSDFDGLQDGCDNCPNDYNPTQEDCDDDWMGDACAISTGISLDCNENGVPDECDLRDGVSEDCNENGIPDECEEDCNGNGVPDDCDIASGYSLDCNENGVPDECDIAVGTSFDCNGNGVPDECDIAVLTSLDCNGNGVPDECDVVDGTSRDCDENSIPDECELLASTPVLIEPGAPNASDVIVDQATGDYIVANGISVVRYDRAGVATVIFSGSPILGLTAIDQEPVSGDFLVTAVRSDDYSGMLFRITADGEGAEVANFGAFSWPYGVVHLDESGDFAVTLRNGPVLRVTLEGTVTTIASGDPLTNLGDLIQEPGTGALIVVSNGTLHRITLDGLGSTIAQGELLADAHDVAFDNWTGDMIVTTGSPPRIVRVKRFGGMEILWEDPLGISFNGIAHAHIEPRLIVTARTGLQAFVPDNDCNNNGVPDICDIESGFSLDVNGNDIPDECEPRFGDMNCDTVVDFADVTPFNLALQSEEAYLEQYPHCRWLNADCNCDWSINALDVTPFVACLVSGDCGCP